MIENYSLSDFDPSGVRSLFIKTAFHKSDSWYAKVNSGPERLHFKVKYLLFGCYSPNARLKDWMIKEMTTPVYLEMLEQRIRYAEMLKVILPKFTFLPENVPLNKLISSILSSKIV